MGFALLVRSELKEYDLGSGHIFRGDRFVNFAKFLQQRLPPDHNYQIIKAEPATDEDLLSICDKDYIEFTKEYYRAANAERDYEHGSLFSKYQSGDNVPLGTPGKIEEAARIIVGQGKLACDLVHEGKFKKAVSIGGGLHHAKHNYGEGFCLYNDVAFCGKYLIGKHKLERVLILDTDAHAANGTSEYFYDDPRVLLIDIHQDPATIYPGTGFANEIGSGKGTGYTINIPVPVRGGDNSYKLFFESIIEPVVKEFKPQIIVRNGGSDPHFSDGLTTLGLTLNGFRMVGDKVRTMAEICDGKVVDLIASGYNEQILPYAWMAYLAGLNDLKPGIEGQEQVPVRFQNGFGLETTKKTVSQLKEILKPYWQCFL